MMLLAGGANAEPPTFSAADLLGTWECGPTSMHGPGFDLDVLIKTTNHPDGTYTSSSTSIIKPHGKSAVTNLDESKGTWVLQGDLLTTVVESARFISSTDPTFSRNEGQLLLEDELHKKRTYEARLLELKDGHSRTVPVGSLYPEAVTESSCRLLPSPS
ncbi:hypothetical protein [Stenotrophomonas sp. Iso1]|uniref:hypothetical protein n=1 Tax=Stenotrophomonas sp. Iso1 TaxID=2977283 RepID=UPI0022B7CA0E|nr:hypothetical protein [Stenotrophomonas sp. Iso1]